MQYYQSLMAGFVGIIEEATVEFEKRQKHYLNANGKLVSLTVA